MNVPSEMSFPDCLPISSTSGVGSTPGNRTKNVGVMLFISTFVYVMSKGGASTYSIPMLSPTNYLRAFVNLSGLIALSSKHLWNKDMLLKLFGRSHFSGHSSEYHFLHMRLSLSILLVRLPKMSTFSRPFTAGHIVS